MSNHVVLDRTEDLMHSNPHISNSVVPSLGFNFISGGVSNTGKKTLIYKMSALSGTVYVDKLRFSSSTKFAGVENFRAYHIDSVGRSLCIFSFSELVKFVTEADFDAGFWALTPEDKIVVEFEGSNDFSMSLIFSTAYSEKSFYNVHRLEHLTGEKTYYVRDFDSLAVCGDFECNGGLNPTENFVEVSHRFGVPTTTNAGLSFNRLYDRGFFSPFRSFDINSSEGCLVHTQRSVFNRNNVLTMLSVMRNLRKDIMYSEKENFMNEVYRHVLGRGIKFSDVSDIIDNYELFLRNTPHLGTFDSYAVPAVNTNSE